MSSKSSLLNSLLLWLYGVIFQIAAHLLRCASLVMPKLRQQLAARQVTFEALPTLKTQRDQAERGVLFFCSSAGEYEQAKPLIERLRADGKTFCVVIFLSVSGARYAAARKESLPCLLMPTDETRFWHRLFDAVRPELTCVIRHELWPGFLSVARQRSRLILINGTVDGQVRPLRDLIKGQLLSLFHGVTVVSGEDESAFQRLGLPAERIAVLGDTKFDRVVERAAANHERAKLMAAQLDKAFGPYRRLVIGSAWQPEVDVVLEAYRRFVANGQGLDWQVVIAPHDVGPAMVEWIVNRCREFGFGALRFSELSTAIASFDRKAPAPILVVDSIGHLAELYASGQLAFVGGGLADKVHNVLEPASYGAFIAMGPRFSNSREAVLLEREGLLSVVANSDQCLQWWSANHQVARDAVNNRLATRIRSLAGASDRLMQKYPLEAMSRA